MIKLMVICIFVYLFGGAIVSALGVAAVALAAVPGKIWGELVVYVIIMFVYECSKKD